MLVRMWAGPWEWRWGPPRELLLATRSDSLWAAWSVELSAPPWGFPWVSKWGSAWETHSVEALVLWWDLALGSELGPASGQQWGRTLGARWGSQLAALWATQLGCLGATRTHRQDSRRFWRRSFQHCCTRSHHLRHHPSLSRLHTTHLRRHHRSCHRLPRQNRTIPNWSPEDSY